MNKTGVGIVCGRIRMSDGDKRQTTSYEAHIVFGCVRSHRNLKERPPQFEAEADGLNGVGR